MKSNIICWNRMKLFCLLFLSFSASAGASDGLAGESSQITYDQRYLLTSGDYSLQTKTLSYKLHRRDLYYPYENEAITAIDYGFKYSLYEGWNKFSFKGDKISVYLGFKQNEDWYYELNVGNNNVELLRQDDLATTEVESGYDRSSLLTNSILLQWNDSKTQEQGVSFEYHKDLLCNQAILNQNHLANLSYAETRISFFKKWQKKWMLKFFQKNREISDSNLKVQRDMSVNYGYALGDPWIWFGLGVEHLSFKNTVLSYWSPKDFLAYGPRMEAAWGLPYRLQFSLGVNYNFLQDNDLAEQGQGHYISAKLRYGDRNSNNVSFSINDSYSMQRGAQWAEKEYLGQLNYFF